MSYLAIARKWRPLAFEEIVGQKHVTRTLRNAITMDRIHHAFLFTGPRGVGKTTAARVLSRALCCEQGPTPEPCGTCVLCTSILAGSAPDVIEIDGASNNSVDDVRELREGVRYLPSQARYRIYIIDEVHMLTKQAFNALLKTLEEPPPHVVFVFATTEPQKIPETILSRVQRFDFKRISGTQVAGRLAAICEAEGVKVSEHALRLVARAGEGSMRDAQSLLDQVISFSGLEVEDRQVTELLGLVDRSLLYDMLAGLVSGDPAKCLDAIAQVHEFGFEMDQFTSELLELLRNAALVAMAPDARRHLDLSDDEVERLAGIADGLSPELFARWFDALLEVHDRVARAARPRMVLEMAVARLASIRPVEGLDRVMARLEDLDRRLRQGGFRPSPAAGKRGGPPFPKGGADPAPSGSAAPAPAERRGPAFGDSGRGGSSAQAPRAAPPDPAPAPPDPAPIPAATEPESPGLPLPEVGPEDDAQTRYGAVLDLLEGVDLSWASLVEHSVALSWSGQELKVAFASQFQLDRGRPRVTGAQLRPVLAHAFPGLTRVEAVLREQPDGRPETRHEARKAARARYVEELRQEIDGDPAISRLRVQLGLVLHDFEPKDSGEQP